MKIKLFILGLVFACLGLTSFSSAGSITYTGHYSKAITSSSSTSNGSVYFFSLPFELSSSFADIGISSGINNFVSSVSCSISNLTNSAGLTFTNNTRLVIYYLKSTNEIVSFYTSLSEAFGEGTLTFNFNSLSSYKGYLFGFSLVPYYSRPNSAGTISFDYSCVVSGDDIGLSSGSSDCPTCPTCPTCEVCQECDDCSSLSGDLATCQGSLGACLEDNISLENMNSSLQDQLSQCLVNSNACDPTEDEDCYTGAYQLFHVFRQNQGSDFSLPISNNIFLPNGLRAYTESGVVALAPLTANDYSLDRESGEILNDLVIKIFYYLAVLLSVMALAYYIKKFLSFTLFPKKD